MNLIAYPWKDYAYKYYAYKYYTYKFYAHKFSALYYNIESTVNNTFFTDEI